MQNKWLTKTLLGILVLFCLFQAGLSIAAYQTEQKALKYAQTSGLDLTEEQLQRAYLDSVAHETVFRIPLLGEFSYEAVKSRQLQLGLDLRGGVRMVLAVEPATPTGTHQNRRLAEKATSESNLLSRTRHMLSQRLSHSGVDRAQITIDTEKQRLIVEVPGAKDVQRIRELVLAEAHLAFYEVYQITDPEILASFYQADQQLELIIEKEKE